MAPFAPLCLSVCFSTSGSRKVNTISATSSLPDSSLHVQKGECVSVTPHPYLPPSFPPSRVFCLMCQCVDDIRLSPNLLSCLLVCRVLHRLQDNVLQVGVHCTLVHTHHLVGHNMENIMFVTQESKHNMSTLSSCAIPLSAF